MLERSFERLFFGQMAVGAVLKLAYLAFSKLWNVEHPVLYAAGAACFLCGLLGTVVLGRGSSRVQTKATDAR